jgi:hypothetical protein
MVPSLDLRLFSVSLAHFDQVPYALDPVEPENDGLGHLLEEEGRNLPRQDNGPAVYSTMQLSQGVISARAESPKHEIMARLISVSREPAERQRSRSRLESCHVVERVGERPKNGPDRLAAVVASHVPKRIDRGSHRGRKEREGSLHPSAEPPFIR